MIDSAEIVAVSVLRMLLFNFKDLQSLKINSNILRSETAVISSLSIINYFLNL